MPEQTIRILSDLHYGERASRIRGLEQLRPLTTGIAQLVLNGDSMDTRAGPNPAHTATCRAEINDFAATAPPTSILTGNHDPDISPEHVLHFAGGRVVVTHGDIVFDDIVPWGQDAAVMRKRIAAARADLPHGGSLTLAQRFAIWRRVAASIPQRHQSEQSFWKFAVHFVTDTIWPPSRVFRILRTWQATPRLAADFARQHWPEAKFLIMGHTHHPGIWRPANGPVIINTGSFCPPTGGVLVDLLPDALLVRKIGRRPDGFQAETTVARLRL